jgi:ABC-type methionine transport system ATPase subunit
MGDRDGVTGPRALAARTVHGNLAFGLDAKKVPRSQRDDRIAAILSRVGLSGKDRR